MGALIKGAHFKKGSLSVAAKGSFDESSVLVKISDTTLKNLNPLNNILAFLDTIPALITFSLPDYSTKGMYVKSAVVGMKIQNDLATIESFDVKSSVLTISGTGWISVPQNLINMDLNMITQAKTNLTKIPLIGYIIAGKEKRPSITLKVSGPLNDPTVKNSMFKEVASTPFSILYRTLTLPYYLVESMVDSSGNRKEKKDSNSPAESSEYNTTPETVQP